MIVQTAPAGMPRLVIRHVDHAAMSGKFAQAFGGGAFDPLAPADLMVWVAAHHDDGWLEIDSDPLIDPETNLPYNLADTPWPTLMRPHAISPEVAEAYHPYCGLLVSMHTTGLYNGRYGVMSASIDIIPDALRPAAEAMLAAEDARQARLRDICADDPALAALCTPEALMANYRRLQFVDALAVILNLRHPTQQKPYTFARTPRSVGDEVDIVLTPAGDGCVTLDPYPFRDAPLTVSVGGRWIEPGTPDPRAALTAAPVVDQAWTLMPV
ncbi:MAG: hypothetical protein UZ13_03103 [Chloroflexi bacterium OLB13]|nr:MAG: hypothetical protein UZ13_03103 [Chloroflexi bacterium OLB13]